MPQKARSTGINVMQDLLTILETARPSLSKGQKLIADYIRNHYDKAAYMTASRLGSEVGVSESTVVRFALELGYDGYPALQHMIQETVRMRLTSLQRIEVANHRIGEPTFSTTCWPPTRRSSSTPWRIWTVPPLTVQWNPCCTPSPSTSSACAPPPLWRIF